MRFTRFRPRRWFQTAAMFLCLALPTLATAQEQPASPPPYSPEQLDQLLAPVALYPDALVEQILMAATYPLEVGQADRWLKDPNNANLRGPNLEAALQQQPWEPSVKSLVPFPQVLQLMDNDLQWTEQLGDAFMAEQQAVMDSVQRLRWQAQNAGSLRSTPQQTIVVEREVIRVVPATPQVVYVPYYDPAVVYGPWPYPTHPPVVFRPLFRLTIHEGSFSFSLGLPVLSSFWAWERWDWHRRVIIVDNERYRRINFGRPPLQAGTWRHDPIHRMGVPYRSPAVRAMYQHTSDKIRRNFRGFAEGSPSLAQRPAAMRPRPSAPQQHPAGPGQFQAPGRPMQAQPAQRAQEALTQQQHPSGPGQFRPMQAQPAQRPQEALTQQQTGRPTQQFQRPTPTQQTSRPAQPFQHQPAQRQAQQTPRQVSPLFESYAHGADARAHAQQGRESRQQAERNAAQRSPEKQPRQQEGHGPQRGQEGRQGDRPFEHR